MFLRVLRYLGYRISNSTVEVMVGVPSIAKICVDLAKNIDLDAPVATMKFVFREKQLPCHWY